MPKPGLGGDFFGAPTAAKAAVGYLSKGPRPRARALGKKDYQM